MRRKQTQSISDVIRQFQKESAYEGKLVEKRLMGNWSKVLGSGIASSTRKLYIQNRTLFVHIESAVMREELTMIRTQILAALNKSVGTEVIDKIIFR